MWSIFLDIASLNDYMHRSINSLKKLIWCGSFSLGIIYWLTFGEISTLYHKIFHHTMEGAASVVEGLFRFFTYSFLSWK